MCRNCGYSFVNESMSPGEKTFCACPRCGYFLSPPVKVGRKDEGAEDKKVPYTTIIEHDTTKGD